MRVSMSFLLSTRIGKNALLIEQKQKIVTSQAPDAYHGIGGYFYQPGREGLISEDEAAAVFLVWHQLLLVFLLFLLWFYPPGFGG